jgi:glycosyltransferase involved in cell wall biosynthesis
MMHPSPQKNKGNHDPAEPEVTIVLPAYNEEANIRATIARLKESWPAFEILVIDDGSTDGTVKEAIDAGANVWPHPYNMGNGAAVKTGLRCAKGKYVILMDADGQHNPEDIANLLDFRDRFDMVVGARTKESSTSIHRDIANKIYNAFASYVTKFNVQDLTSGFRLVRKDTISNFIYLLPNTFSYPSTLTMAYLRSGLSIKYIPIQTKKRKGSSKIKLIHDGTRFFLIITKIATLFSPFRVFLPVSAALFLTGLGYYIYTFITAHRFSNMSALLFSTSVIVFMIGLVSEQISQARYDRTT